MPFLLLSLTTSPPSPRVALCCPLFLLPRILCPSQYALGHCLPCPIPGGVAASS